MVARLCALLTMTWTPEKNFLTCGSGWYLAFIYNINYIIANFKIYNYICFKMLF